jgi:2-polyprenyl-6-methoxyphenol hydroxylase-like FAD-dependent oxidoreductase
MGVMDTDVVIVGGGPVGLCLAVDLGWRGVDCILLEKLERGAARFPTANHIGVRTMEHLRRLGLAGDVARAFRPDWGGHWVALTHLGGHEVARVENALAGPPPPHSPEREVWAPKPCFDPILEEAASGCASVSLRFGTRAERVSNEGDRVSCVVAEGSGATEEIRARWAVACDGASSAVRKACGIELLGTPPLPFRIHSAFFRSRRVGELVPHGAVQITLLGTPDGPTPTPFGAGVMVAVDGRELWRLHGPGLDAADEEATRRRLVELGATDAEILATSAWTPAQGLCTSFRAGRVFLAGDAAHVVTPYGGLGVNTGMADAFDLAWKMEATLAGFGGARLLDESYDVERRAAARDLLRYQGVDLDASTSVLRASPLPRHEPPHAGLWGDGPEGERERRRYGEALVSSRKYEYDKPGIDLGYRYDGSPIVCDDGTPAPDRSDVSRYEQTAKPGGRAPHASLGGGRSTLDLYGRGFVLVRTRDDAGVGGFPEEAARRRMPLRIETVRQIEAAHAAVLTLVRPDGFVAWRGDALPADAGSILDVVRGAA